MSSFLEVYLQNRIEDSSRKSFFGSHRFFLYLQSSSLNARVLESRVSFDLLLQSFEGNIVCQMKEKTLVTLASSTESLTPSLPRFLISEEIDRLEVSSQRVKDDFLARDFESLTVDCESTRAGTF